MDKIDVLDHGFVRLVESMGSDLSIVRAARVSYDAAWRAGEDTGSDKRLIKYLWKNHHTSPFEAVEFQFEVKAPIFVLRQWHRHRTWTYNELSARYRELPEEYYVPKPEHVGTQSKDNKQMRDFDVEAKTLYEQHTGNDPTIHTNRFPAWSELNEEAKNLWRAKVEKKDMLIPSIIDHACSAAFETYRDLLSKNVPREIARSVLPVATYSHMFAKVDLLNLFRFLTLRCHSHAQYEIRVYAEAMLELISDIVPVAVEAWKETASK